MRLNDSGADQRVASLSGPRFRPFRNLQLKTQDKLLWRLSNLHHTRPITSGMAGLAALRVAARLKSKGARSHIRSVEEQAQYLSEERRDEELYVRASAGDHERVGFLLRAGARPEAFTGDTGLVALLSAAKEGHARVVETLLGSRCMELHVDHLSKLSSEPLITSGASALMLASLHGHVAVCEILLKNGANSDLQSSNKNTALIIAAIRGHTSVIDVLISGGASIDIRGEGGGTALMKACYAGHLSAAQKLLEAGADYTIRSTGGERALKWAQVSLTKVSGHCCSVCTSHSRTLLSGPQKQGHRHIQALLFQHGAVSELPAQTTHLFRGTKGASTSSTDVAKVRAQSPAKLQCTRSQTPSFTLEDIEMRARAASKKFYPGPSRASSAASTASTIVNVCRRPS